jgi:hypothetical protein
VRVRGLINLLHSFAKIDYQSICNGGPIIMELSNSFFRNAESIRKTAMLVRIFVQLGCHRRNVRHDGTYQRSTPLVAITHHYTDGQRNHWSTVSQDINQAATRAALLKYDRY